VGSTLAGAGQLHWNEWAECDRNYCYW
jgi:hypothetical protein